MGAKTLDQSHSKDCGICKGKGLVAGIAQQRTGNNSMQPIMVEYLGDREPHTYKGKATGTLYTNIQHETTLQVYLADYLADPTMFNEVR